MLCEEGSKVDVSLGMPMTLVLAAAISSSRVVCPVSCVSECACSLPKLLTGARGFRSL